MPGERAAVITGIGQTDVGRRLGRDQLDLTLDAVQQAIVDAGLTRQDIDGLATFPGAVTVSPGFSGPGTAAVQDALRLELNWSSAGLDGSGPFTPLVNAAMAIAGGLARHVVVYRTLTESTAQGRGGRRGSGGSGPGKVARGFDAWLLPFHAYSTVNWLALYAARHMHEYGTTRAQLGAVAVTARAHAGRNPKAIYRDPLTLDEYLDARMISTPFGLYDCDVPCDGSTAFVLSHVDHAASAPRPSARVEAAGVAMHGRPSWDQYDDLTEMAMHDAARQLWSRTDLRPDDVDVAELYDGFSFLALLWLEALGFCAKGEGGPFVEGGKRIGLDGDLPLNTDGGQLSAGRLHGFGRLYEACLQLRGEAGDRQVGGGPEIALASAGGGPLGGCLLLSRWDGR